MGSQAYPPSIAGREGTVVGPAERHSIAQTLALHLLPGAAITLFAYLIVPGLERAGYPSLMAVLLAIPCVLVPWELGTLLVLGWRRNGRLSLDGIVLYRRPMPFWQYLAFGLPLLVWSIACFTLLAPVDKFFIEKVFDWLPSGLLPTAQAQTAADGKALVVLLANLTFNGILGPVIEELYFRGYLLPRIAWLGCRSPLVGVLLFSLYHFFSPWQNVTRILALLPLVYMVWRKQNIGLSMGVHVSLNTLGILAALLQ